MSRTLEEVVRRFEGQTITVVGDVMLDHFVVGRVDRLSPEAPVPIVTFDHDEFRLGGAANVAHNLAALGADARLVGLIGNDDTAQKVRAGLSDAGLRTEGLVADPDRQTTRKVRVVTSRNQQVVRVDYESATDIAGAVLERLAAQVCTSAAGARAIVLSDYRKGVVSTAVIDAARRTAERTGAPLLVDPKVPQPDWYRGASLITPNHHEAELMTQMSIRTKDDCSRAARLLAERTGASVLITWGEHGMWVLDRSDGRFDEAALPATAREVADVTGAGDTVIAVLALALSAGARLADAARLANAAAGLVVARFGPVAVSREALLSSIGDSPA